MISRLIGIQLMIGREWARELLLNIRYWSHIKRHRLMNNKQLSITCVCVMLLAYSRNSPSNVIRTNSRVSKINLTTNAETMNRERESIIFKSLVYQLFIQPQLHCNNFIAIKDNVRYLYVRVFRKIGQPFNFLCSLAICIWIES